MYRILANDENTICEIPYAMKLECPREALPQKSPAL